MTGRLHVFCDLEGVLVPEMWPCLARRFALPALARTTRDVPDYRALMRHRLATLRAHRLTLADIGRGIAGLRPYPGAVAFLAALRRRGPVTIVSDSFAPMNAGLLTALGDPDIVCHRFDTDDDGFVAACRYWNDLAGKHLCLSRLAPGAVGFALGDAFNDLTLLRAATHGLLFRPSPRTAAAAPDLRVVTRYRDVLAAVDGAGAASARVPAGVSSTLNVRAPRR